MEGNPISEAAQPHLPKFNWGQWYDKTYKLWLVLPLILLALSLTYIAVFASSHGDIFNKDVTLTGGTALTVYTDKAISAPDIEKFLKPSFDDVVIRILTDFATGKQIAFTIESQSEPEPLKAELTKYLGYELTEKNSSVEFTGASLSKSFYKELMTAMLLAFAFMSITIFVIFRIPLPSVYVILCAFTDIVVPLAVIDLIGLRVSTAGIAAFLMLIGYSVDTDILLTIRVLKRREESLNQRIKNAFKTGITMTLTALAAVLVAYFIVTSPVLKQIFFILSIGLVTDIIATWMMNASLLKWYCERRGIA